MRKISYLLTILLIGVVFNACGTKTHYFTPTTYEKIKAKKEKLSIEQTNSNFAKLSKTKPMQFINKDKKIITIKNYKNFMMLDKYEDKVVLANEIGDLIILQNTGNDNLLYDKNTSNVIYSNKFFSSIILANLKDDILAAISADNTLYAINIQSGELLFTHKQSSSLGQTSKIANPIILNNIIIYPTLDAKLVFFDLNTKSIIKNIPVGYEQFFNNILLLTNTNTSLSAVSTSKAICINDNNVANINVSAKNALTHKNYLYIVTDDARVLKLNQNLQEVASTKFEFAKINDMIFIDNDLYLLESNGYMIKIDENLENTKIYKITNYKNKKTYATTSGFYFGKYFIKFD